MHKGSQRPILGIDRLNADSVSSCEATGPVLYTALTQILQRRGGMAPPALPKVTPRTHRDGWVLGGPERAPREAPKASKIATDPRPTQIRASQDLCTGVLVQHNSAILKKK